LYFELTVISPDLTLLLSAQNYETLADVIRENKVPRLMACALILFLGSLSAVPEKAQAGTDAYLGTAGNFQIVSGAATTLGASLNGPDASNITSSSTVVADLRGAIATISALSATAVAADLGGSTFTPGAYISTAAIAMTADVILDGKNSCDSKFIFITPAAMNTTAGISITLINGAKASNVYWVAGGAITIAASGYLAGNFLSSAAITVGAGSSLNGRFMAMQAVTVGASVSFMGFPIEGCSAPAGGLSISVPETASTRELQAGETVTIELGPVVVTDTRGITTGASWDVSTVSQGVRNSSGNTLGGDQFSYALREITFTAGTILVTHAPPNMSALSEVLSAEGGLARNSATWTPVITIVVPADQAGGTYSGTIVHSVS
jgi:hypothetical protein